MRTEPKAPETKSKKKIKKGKVHNRGRNPNRSSPLTNISTLAMVTPFRGAVLDKMNCAGRLERRISHQGDVGYGVAQKDGRFSVFTRVWVEENGRRYLKTIAVLRKEGT